MVTAGDVSDGEAFDLSLSGLDKGLWYFRAFAVGDEGVTASQQTYKSVLGTETWLPTGVLVSSEGADAIAQIYDGATGAWPDNSWSAQFIFDISSSPQRIAAVRIWPRNSSPTAINRIWLRFMTLSLEYNAGPVAWNDRVAWRTGMRPVDKVSSVSGGSWVSASSDFDRYVDHTPSGTTLPAMLEFTFDRPIRAKALRVKGPLYWNVAEVELRLMPREGMMFLVR